MEIMPRSKKRPVKKAIAKRRSWLWQGLGWLAGVFGLAIALLAVVLYREQTVQTTEISQLTPTAWELVKEWNFSTSDQVGEGAWQAYQSDKDTEYHCGLGDKWVKKKKDCGNQVVTDEKTTGRKVPLPLVVVESEAVVGGAGLLGTSTTLFNTNLSLDIPEGTERLRVEVAAKADFHAVVPWFSVKQNSAEMNLNVISAGGQRAGRLTKTSAMPLGASGEAVYAFEFPVDQYGALKIVDMSFRPAALGRIYFQNLKVDRITLGKI